MSGHVIVAPVVFPVIEVVVPAGIAVTAVAGLAYGVKKLVDLSVEAAREKVQAQKQEFAGWVSFLEEQGRQMAALQVAEQYLANAEKRLALAELGNVRAVSAAQTAPAPEMPASAYLSIGLARLSKEEVRSVLDELAQIVDAFPEMLRQAAGSPFPILDKQSKRLVKRFEGGEDLDPSELATFRELLAQTLHSFGEDVRAKQDKKKTIRTRMESIVDAVLLCGELAGPKEQANLDSLRRQVEALLAAPDLKEGQLDVLERRLNTIKAAVNARVSHLAHRSALCESMTRNLTQMGYRTVAPFPEDVEADTVETVLRVPGGERVRVALLDNNQVAFQVLHERSLDEAKSPSLSPEELDRLRRQEERWCRDFRELLRRVIAEGFSYQISLEKAIPEDSVKVVIVETPDEILAREEEESRFTETEDRRLSS